jgi:hypothetical protein
MTAYGALVNYGKLKQGDVVLITAASSSSCRTFAEVMPGSRRLDSSTSAPRQSPCLRNKNKMSGPR